MNYKIKDAYYSEYMFVYASQSYTTVLDTIKVYIPDVMTDKKLETPLDNIVHPLENIFINSESTKPNISGTCVISNYIELKVMKNSLNGLSISQGDKLLAAFINNNPNNGYVIGKG